MMKTADVLRKTARDFSLSSITLERDIDAILKHEDTSEKITPAAGANVIVREQMLNLISWGPLAKLKFLRSDREKRAGEMNRAALLSQSAFNSTGL